MKKIMYVMSALAAVFSGNALADVSVSGSGKFNYTSSGSSGFASTSGGISFALSTTTAGGVAISTSGGITQDAEGTAADGHTGFTSLAFATGGTTITLSNDISAGSVGSVGGVASDMVDVGHDTIGASPALAAALGDPDGGGISIATSMGGAAVTATYVWDTTPEDQGQTDTSASNTVTGVKVSMPMGALTVSASHVMYNPGGSGTDDTLSGGSVAYAVGGGTLTLGYESSTGSVKATETSGAYSMSLDADTTIKVGYTQADEGNTSNSITEASVTRALGGGASVYAEMKSSSGSGTSTTSSTEASTFAIGTSVAF